MLDYEGAKCPAGHRLELVSEGYGLCTGDAEFFSAWAFSKPVDERRWTQWRITGKDDSPILAWLGGSGDRESCIDEIREDIDARRAMPFNEEVERARLMPV